MRIVLLIVFSTLSLCGYSFGDNHDFVKGNNKTGILKNLCAPTVFTGAINGSPICAGTVISVPYSFTDCVDANNVFTVELSDASGSFASPTVIGSLATTGAGSISSVIPASINTLGSGYRIRVNASSPATTGSDNGVDITIIPKPNASFNINAVNQCIDANSYNFSNSSTGSITSYQWNLGDGTTSNNTNITNKIYSAPGNYNVKLVATGTNGCKDSVTQTVSVNSKPVVNFNVDNAAKCQGVAFAFNNASSNAVGTLTYNWNFGDGNASSSVNASKAYNASGVYNVKLVGTTTGGCRDSITKQVTVLPKENASFTVNNPVQCINQNNFVFTNTTSGSTTAQWDFGDNISSNIYSPVKAYSGVGTYVVKLIATNVNGCKDSATTTVTLLDKPTANFNFSGNQVCSNNLTYTFNNSSTGVGNTYRWSFGDGDTSIATNPTKTYNIDGSYTVSLTATNNNGCRDTKTQTISITKNAVASFTVNNNNQCLNGNSFSFTNTSNGSVVSSFWSFGDGITSTVSSPVKTYSSNGNYVVKLVVTNANGCKDSTTQVVTVRPKPNPSFTYTGNTNCSSNYTLQFNNTTTGAGNAYTWNFGDGTSSNAISPAHTYAGGGVYVVTLIVTNSNTCTDSISTTVSFTAKPTVAFALGCNASAVQCLNTNNFCFTNNSTGAATYLWRMGNGTTFTTTDVTNYKYTSAGTYKITLIATSFNGCVDSTSVSVTVLQNPAAAFTANYTGCNNLTAGFSQNNTNLTASSSWNFGDGTPVVNNVSNTTHTYAAPGSYTVRYTVADAGNFCTDTASQTILLSPNPTANFSIASQAQCANNNLFVITNTSVNGVAYSWNFGNGITSTQTNPSVSYSSAGVYTIKLVVTSVNGCRDSMSQTVTVSANPVAGFNILNNNICGNKTIGFINTTTPNAGNVYSWSFGDGNMAATYNAANIYAAAGSYNVKLVVTNTAGCRDSVSKTAQVILNPTASFTVNNNTQCLNANAFVFTNQSTGNTFNSWTFGDASGSTQVNPTHIYNNAGVYTVKLVVTNASGCKDSISTTVTVNARPVSSFTFAGTTNCTSNRTISIIDNSNGAASYSYDFGDGTSSSLANPIKTYITAGTYIIKQVVTNTNGCSDSSTRTVTFTGLPTASFTVNNNNQCANNNLFVFTNTSTGNAANSWTFGDASGSTQVNPTHVYNNAGVYTVKLVVTNASGCKDSISTNVTVNTRPISAFTFAGTTNCTSNRTISIIDNSNGAASYNYDFGDGTMSSIPNPTKTYTSTGTFIIKQVVTNANGCKDSSSQTVIFTGLPTAAFSVNNNNQCANNNLFVFTNTSTGNAANSWTFGDASGSTQVNPTHVYNNAGVYSVKLVVINPSGCKDSISTTVAVNARPVSSFTLTGTTNCTSNRTISIIDGSNGAANYSYDFGDGTSSSLANPIKTYIAAGIYIIKQVVTNANGCKDSSSQTVIFTGLPIAAFSVNNNNQCANNNLFVFTNTSTGNAANSWTFGDASGSTQVNPTHVYNNAGVYTVKLVVINPSGCKDSISTSVTVNARPVSAFTFAGTTNCTSNRTISIIDNSNGAASYSYDFGDGTSSSLANPIKTYITAGTYIIKQVVTNANGCKDSTLQAVTFTGIVSASFNASINNTCTNTNGSLTINNTSVNATAYSWSFGDGTTSTSANPTHIYTTTGNYTIKLVASNGGCVDSATQAINFVARPTAAFTAPEINGCVSNNMVSFTNNSTNAISYNWNFGDGQTSSLAAPTHTYTSTGTYNVKLVVFNGNGCSDSVTHTISFNARPMASFNAVSSNSCNNSFTFNNTSNANAANATYMWTFGDGTFSFQNSPVKAYTATGTYTVRLIVTNSNGCKDTATSTVTVDPQPKADFIIPNFNACANNNTITVQSISNNAVIFNWYFGDGTTANTSTFTKTYAAAGTYNIKLVVANANGCTDSIVKQVSISTKPMASFVVNNTTQCVNNNSFIFNNTSVLPNGVMSYNWSFGDGTTSTQSSPVKVYSNAGNYFVRLIVTNANGLCADTTSTIVTVSSKPTANFNINNATLCSANRTISFTNASSNAIAYSWSFGDGNSSVNINPVNTYAATGNYNVQLIATNANGCSDTINKTVAVAALPTAAYAINNTIQCTRGNQFVFTNGSVNATNYVWSFGDGVGVTTNNANHVYTNTGTFNTYLVAINANGCTDTAKAMVTVNVSPGASFNYSGATNCTNNLTLQFNSTSVNGNSYNWSFGDGQSSTALNPNHTYATAGTYNVILVVANVNGCVDSMMQQVTFSSQPGSSFTVVGGNQCVNNNSYSFINNSTNAASYSWSFGDGQTSSLQNPTVTYVNAGTYTVTLNAFGTNNSCVSSSTQTVTVLAKPISSFNTNNFNACTDGLTVKLNNTSSGASSYTWDFGNGTNSNQTSPTVTYSNAGTYTITLSTVNANGCTDVATRTVNVADKTTSNFTVVGGSQCANNNLYSFVNNSTNAASYSWSFGNGQTSTLQNPTVTYANAGTFSVTLTTTGANGCIATSTQTLTVLAKPIASFNTNNFNACADGLTVKINNTSSGATSYAWNYGNGILTNVASPTITYSTSGTYTITLTAAGANGCADTVSKTVTVADKISAAFTVSGGSQCVNGNAYSFITNSTNAVSYSWSFGDGQTSTLQNPAVTYANAGTFTVTLTATGANGCTATSTQTVTVLAKPIASFNTNNFNACADGLTVKVNNTSSGATSYIWNYGNGILTNVASPAITYSTAGTYTITLTAAGANGCADTVSKTVTVADKTTAVFTVSGNSQCANNNLYSFINNSINAVSYNWSFGDGQTSTLQNPNVSYASAGTYNITLTVTGSNGCTATSTKSVTVSGRPVASFNTNGYNSCTNGNVVTLNNTSSGASTYTWDFGNGIMSNANNPTITYTNNGTYIIRLIAGNANGCADTSSQTITIINKPTSSFTVSGGSQCVNSVVVFNSTSVNAASYNWNFGNGQTSTLSSPTATYSSGGTYTVTLTTTGVSGCTATSTQQVTVIGKPTASFNTSNPTCANNLTIDVTGTANNATNYSFSFGDGATASTQNATHTYAGAGTYTVTLIAGNANGCRDTVSKTITLADQTSAAFTVNNASQCINGNNFILTNAGINGISYTWSFGDGQTANTQNAAHTYSSAGTYTIRLVATGSNGCTATVTQSVLVAGKPTASFNTNGFNSCTNSNTITLTNTSVGAVNYVWNFGDNTSSAQANTTHTYTNAGTYTITLVASNATGCSDSTSQTITTSVIPAASFTVNNAAQCLSGNSFIFTATQNSLYKYSWNFGDGSSALNSAIQTHTYISAGTYTVTLTVANADNSCSKTYTSTIQVVAKPIAAFSTNSFNACTNRNLVTLTNNSTGGTSYSWDFGDSSNSTSTNTIHQYTALGSYVITLIATNNVGCSDTTRQTITTAVLPVASLTVNSEVQCLKGNNFRFDAGIYKFYTYQWNFGDGTSTTRSSVSFVNHTYTTAGTYTVTLTVTDVNGGCPATTTKVVNVLAAPVASFTINNAKQCINGNRFVFTNTSANGINYSWDFGDSTNSTAANAVRIFTTAGSYVVTLVADNGTCADTARAVVSIGQKPNPSFVYNTNNLCTNTGIIFTNTNFVNSESYIWKFGDGTTSIDVNPAKLYTTAGNYAVTLVATGSNGMCSDSVSRNVLVAVKPTANFTANAITPCSNTYQFTNTSTGNLFSTTWDFGDNGLSNINNPNHTYSNVQNYIVKLKVESSPNCADSIFKTISIYPKPQVSFTQSAINGCAGNNNFTFTSLSTAGVFGILNTWTFGDGTNAVGSVVNKVYLTPGVYFVKLVSTVISSGCMDSVVQPITVYPRPAASISGGGTVCLGTSVILPVRLNGTPPFTFVYSNGATLTTVNNVYDSVYYLNITPTASTTYSLVSMSDKNCSIADSNMPSRAVVDVKTLYFQSQPTNVITCLGRNILLTAKAYSANTTFTYQWLKNGQPISNATKDTLIISNATAADAGFYRLTAITTCGTFATNTATVRVDALPNPPVFTSPYTYCQYATATPLAATGNSIKWYADSVGGFGTAIAPIPNTQKAGLMQYFVTNTTTPSNCESPRFAINVNILAAPVIKAKVLGATNLVPNTTTTLQATASVNTVSVRWYYNNVYAGLTPNDRIVVDFNKTGTYYAEATTADGCRAVTDSIIITKNLGANPSDDYANLFIYPNPVSRGTQFINVYFNNPVNEKVKVRIVGELGHVYKEDVYNYNAANQSLQVDISKLLPGGYYIEVFREIRNSIARGKFIKLF